MRVISAATGCTIRIEESECRVAEGSENSESGDSPNRLSTTCQRLGVWWLLHLVGGIAASCRGAHIPVS